MLELRRLRLLHELAQRGTLSAVAEALSYSPSTISQQLAQLERDAGVALLVPDGRRVRLTEHGAALAAHAARALEADEQIRGELERLQPGIAPARERGEPRHPPHARRDRGRVRCLSAPRAPYTLCG